MLLNGYIIHFVDFSIAEWYTDNGLPSNQPLAADKILKLKEELGISEYLSGCDRLNSPYNPSTDGWGNGGK